jgi:hypothetical protein
MTTVVVVASLVLTVYLELSSKENIMTFKKIAIIVAIVIATVTMLPVIIPVQLISFALWYLGTNQSTNRVTKHANGAKVIEVSGRASRLVGYALKVGGMGLMDLSISPAIALPTKGLVVVRTEMCERYAHLTQIFIGSHELGHLLDPAAKKPFAGANINNEFTADAHAVKTLLLTAVQVKEIFDDLYFTTKATTPAKHHQQLFSTLMTRRDRAIKVAEELLETA